MWQPNSEKFALTKTKKKEEADCQRSPFAELPIEWTQCVLIYFHTRRRKKGEPELDRFFHDIQKQETTMTTNIFPN